MRLARLLMEISLAASLLEISCLSCMQNEMSLYLSENSHCARVRMPLCFKDWLACDDIKGTWSPMLSIHTWIHRLSLGPLAAWSFSLIEMEVSGPPTINSVFLFPTVRTADPVRIASSHSRAARYRYSAEVDVVIPPQYFYFSQCWMCRRLYENLEVPCLESAV